MKLRLVEEYSVKHDSTRYVVERKERFELFWRRVDSCAQLTEAQALFDRFKTARGEWFKETVLDTWTRTE